jgi:uncharacterized membrane protein YhaH (DUF805 family)
MVVGMTDSGVPTAPTPYDVPDRDRAAHRPWSTILMVTHWTTAVICVLAVVLGLVAVLMDNASHDDAWDGFAAGLGVMLIAAGFIVGTVAVVLAGLTRTGRRLADAGTPGPLFWAALVTLIIGLVPLGALGLEVYALTMAGGRSATVPVLVAIPVAGYLLAAAATARAARVRMA